MAINADGAYAAMEIIADFLEDQADVIDGPEGTQRPNKAMQMKELADEILGFLENLP